MVEICIVFNGITYKLREETEKDKPNAWYEESLRGHYAVDRNSWRLTIRRTRGDHNPVSDLIVVAVKDIKTNTKYFVEEK